MAVNFAINVVVHSVAAVAGLQSVQNALQRVSNQAAALGAVLERVFVIFAIIRMIKAFLDLGNSAQELTNKLALVATSSTALLQIQDELFKVSQKSRTSFEDVATLYQRLYAATATLGTSQAQVIQLTESISKAVIISGASAQEAAAGIRQLTQAMGKGRLDGDELRSVLENIPSVADILAKSLGVTRGELRKLGEEGKITTEKIVKAFRDQREEIEGKFGKTVPTVSQSFVQIGNSVLNFATILERTTGLFSGLAKIFSKIATYVDAISSAVSHVAEQAAHYKLDALNKSLDDELANLDPAQGRSADDEDRIARLQEMRQEVMKTIQLYDNLRSGWGREMGLERDAHPIADPKYIELLQHTNAEINKENELLKVNAERREVLGPLLQIEEKFRHQKTPLSEGDKGALDRRMTQLAQMKRMLNVIEDAAKAVFKGMEDSLVSFATTGKFEFKKFADQVIADLLRIAIQAFVTRTLMNAVTGLAGGLFGGGGATVLGGSGFDSGFGAGTTTLTRFAGGGDFTVGGSGPVDSKVVSFRATPGEHVAVTPQGSQRGGGSTEVNVYGAPADTQVQRRSEGGRDIVEVIIGAVKTSMSSGGFDSALKGRFGASPMSKRR